MPVSPPKLFSPRPGEHGMTELHFAAYCGDIDDLMLALDAGLEVNAVDTYRGYAPIHWLADMAASGGSRLEMLRILVKHGADINLVTINGKTASMLAKEAGSAAGDELASELTALGAL
jgi:ankyrin repeat protein